MNNSARSNGNVCHLWISTASSSSLDAYRHLGVLQEFERCFCGTSVVHLINCLLDEAEEIVDVLGRHEVVLWPIVEEQVGIKDLDKQV